MSVGIVIVSHSARLAEGVVELAGQMAHGRVAIIAAGGMNDGSLGTSLERVQTALESADSGAGCVVLYDLGSALLTAEFALEALAPELRKRVRLCGAPLVEGAVAAAVEASVGGSLAIVAQSALAAAALPKAPLEDAPGSVAAVAPLNGGSVSARVLLLNRVGLHARPASLFVQTAAQFQARVQVALGEREADGKRILGLLQLGARCGDELIVRADGPDAPAAVAALVALVQQKFGEEA